VYQTRVVEVLTRHATIIFGPAEWSRTWVGGEEEGEAVEHREQRHGETAGAKVEDR
jgi:hypothetical protein